MLFTVFPGFGGQKHLSGILARLGQMRTGCVCNRQAVGQLRLPFAGFSFWALKKAAIVRQLPVFQYSVFYGSHVAGTDALHVPHHLVRVASTVHGGLFYRAGGHPAEDRVIYGTVPIGCPCSRGIGL